VSECRHLLVPPEGSIKEDLFRRVGEVVVPPEDVGDLHVMVVHHTGEIIGGHPGGLHDDEIVQLVVVELHVPLDVVMELNSPAERRFKTDGGGPAFLGFLGPLFRCQIAACSVIFGLSLKGFRFFPHFLYFFSCAKTRIRFPLSDELVDRLFVERESFHLIVEAKTCRRAF